MNSGGLVAFLGTVFAQAEAPAGAPPGGGFMQMLPLLVIFFAVMYFLMIRPQQKRDRERRELLASLRKGDGVITTGGVCGTIVGLTDTHAVLRVDENVKIEFVRNAIAQVVSREKEAS